MKKAIIFLSILSVMLLNQDLFSQNKIPKDSLLADFDTLFSTIEQVHVDMYANLPKDEFEKKAAKIKAQINKDMTAGDFYLLVAPLVADLGDGHTNIWFPFNVFQEENALLFPYSVSVNENDSTVQVIFSWGPHEDSIPKESIITSINNIPIKQIITQMMHLVSGERDFFKLADIDRLFEYYLYFMLKDSTYNINYIYNNQEKKITAQAIPYQTLLKQYQEYEKKKGNQNNEVNFSFKILKDKNVGIIDFREFTDYKKFKRFLHKTFSTLKKENIPNLIIDIRNNGGGNSSLGDELFQYISPVPFQQFGKTIVKTSNKVKDSYLKNYAKHLSKKDIKELITERKLGIKVYNDTSLIQLRKNKLRYTGHVYLLISHFTFSSAASFSWAFKYFKMGTVVGEESGGMGVCFGDIVSFALPHSKLNYSVSYKKFYQYGAKDNDIHGTIPDYKVKSNKALDYTLKLIETTKTK